MAWTLVDTTNAASWGPIVVVEGSPAFQFNAFQFNAFQMDNSDTWANVNDSASNTWNIVPT